MNDADKSKLHAALAIVVNMEAQLTNLQSRGGRASKSWAAQASKMKDANRAKALKNAAAGLSKLTSDSKTVLKDIRACSKEASDATVLAKYATAKDYRDKVVGKRLATARAFDENAARLINAVLTVLGSDSAGMYPGMSDIDIKTSMSALKDYSHYWNEIRIALAKL